MDVVKTLGKGMVPRAGVEPARPFGQRILSPFTAIHQMLYKPAGVETMIARIWHGRTEAAKADAYFEFLKQRAVPDYQMTTGNRGVFLFRRVEGNEAHFLTLTHWDSLEAIKAFAGTDVSKAKYYPEDADFLLEFEPTVEHYELYVAPGNKS